MRLRPGLRVRGGLQRGAQGPPLQRDAVADGRAHPLAHAKADKKPDGVSHHRHQSTVCGVSDTHPKWVPDGPQHDGAKLSTDKGAEPHTYSCPFSSSLQGRYAWV